MDIRRENHFILLTEGPLSLRIDLAENRAALYRSVCKTGEQPFLCAQLENAPLEPFTPKILPPYRAAQKAGAVKTEPNTLFWNGDTVRAEFDGIGTVAVQVRLYADFVIFRVLSCPDKIERLHFGNVFCADCGSGCSSVGMALNLHTNSSDLLSIHPTPGAAAFREFGIEGAAFAVILCEDARLREVMRTVTAGHTEDIPWSSKGGAFSTDHEDIRHSYLLNSSGITADTAVAWIEATRRFGFSQIDFHGGYTFRFGDFEPNYDLYPGGKQDFAAVIDQLHNAGIQAGLHTYAQFISPESRYVTPVPHPDLGGYPFTLAASVNAEELRLSIVESTAHISTVTGFFIRNSVLVMVDREIMRFNAVGDNEFILCERGALGTTPASHTAGACVKHLFSVFGLLAADPESDLYLEIARNTAAMYNELGFDMIYLDAIDGSDIFAGSDKAWYYAAKFVAELLRHIKRPPILEMSEMWHHFWYFRSRMGAWDHSFRGHKYHLGEHDRSNQRVRSKTLLPQNYGWWFYGQPDPEFPVQVRREFVDDYEYWVCNALKNDWSLSFVPGGDWSLSPLSGSTQRLGAELDRFAGVIRRFEEKRLAGGTGELTVSDERELLLYEDSLLPVTYRKQHIVSESCPEPTIVPAGERLHRLRIENRPFPAGCKNGSTLLCAQHAAEVHVLASQNVQASLTVCGGETAGLQLNAVQTGDFGYARMERIFREKTDLSGTPGLYVSVYGDGKGEILNFQLQGQKYIKSGTLDRIVTVDFTGWKTFRLIESDAHRLEENYWPFSGGGHYNEATHDPAYHVGMDTPFSQYEWHPSFMDVDIYFSTRERAYLDDTHRLSVWMNNMKNGESYSIIIGEVSAFPIDRQPINGLTICVDDQKYPIGGALPTESYIEYDGGSWYGFDVGGNALTDIVYPELPTVTAGSALTVEAAGEYGMELTVGTCDL